MRNIFLFVLKNYLFFLFLVIETLCIVLVVQNSYYQRSSTINSANYITGNVYSVYNRVAQYFYLREENESLAKENAILHGMLKDAYMDVSKNIWIKNDTLFKQKYVYFSAKVINNSVNRRNNFLTLDKGALSGVKPEMAVISSSGIVGIVKNVSPNFSTVMSLLHKDARLSAKIKNNNYFGSLTWDGTDYRSADLADIPKHVVLHKGDTILTSAYSSHYPEGIMVGVIDDFSIKEAANFYSIRVKFSCNYKTLTNVFVIENLFKEEQDKLEKETEESVNDGN